jgi:hypothetical protein
MITSLLWVWLTGEKYEVGDVEEVSAGERGTMGDVVVGVWCWCGKEWVGE